MLTATLVLPVLFAFQDPAAAKPPAAQDAAKPTGTAESAFQETLKAIRAMPRPRSREDMESRQKEITDLVKKALADNEKALAEGEGVYWKAKLEAMTPTGRNNAIASFKKFAETAGTDKSLANKSFAEAFVLAAGDNESRSTAEQLLAKIDQGSLE